MEKDGFKFDFHTQRFLINRWETEIGAKVRDEVLAGLKNSIEIRAILDPYVLNHEDNKEPYGYPIYPPDAMIKSEFWVLTHDDLRGIKFYNEDISNTPSFEKKSLNYASFYNCNLAGSNLERTDLSYARFEKCNLTDAVFADSGGFCTRMTDCVAINACFWQSGFRGVSVFLWARRFKSCYPRAAVNRSPNRIANWFIATFQSKVALTDLVSTLRSASHRSLMAASSVGK